MRRIPVVIALISVWLAVITTDALQACTAFCAVGGEQVLVGNNEDWTNPRTKIWFVPATPGSYGRMYVGFDDLWPQGGMNERGLWFDGFAAPPVNASSSSHLPSFSGNIVDTALAECTTVEEVVRLFSQYNRGFLREGILMFADASGDAVSIEPDAIVRKTRSHFVQTNFHQSRPQSGVDDKRFKTASAILENAGADISVDLFRRILAATRQRGPVPTLYSNVYDLKSRTMYLYYFHDFEHVVKFNLDDELKKGKRVLDIPALFPRSEAAEKFAARRRVEPAGGPSPAEFMFAIAAAGVTVLGIAVFTVIRGGRRGRIGVGAILGTVAIFTLVIGVALNIQRPASSEWTQFSIGPASGISSSIQPSRIRADGITLKAAVAFAYDVPAVRVVAPPWLADTRYSINAAVPPERSAMFRTLLQKELTNRLNLETHFEVRPFDVFVLTASDAPRLEKSTGGNTNVWISERHAQLQDVPMDRLAATLQNILGKPVIDETAISGSYDFDFEWREDRLAALTAALHDRFGLRLAPAKRDMEVLIVDGIRRDATLVLLAHVGRVTRSAPPDIRRRIAHILAIH